MLGFFGGGGGVYLFVVVVCLFLFSVLFWFVFCFVSLFVCLFVWWRWSWVFSYTAFYSVDFWSTCGPARWETQKKRRRKKGKKLLLLDKYNKRLFKAPHFLKARGVYRVLNTQTHEHSANPLACTPHPPPPHPLKWKRKLAGQIRYCANISICCFVSLCHLYLYAQPLPDVVSHYSVSHHVCWRYWTV